MDNAEKVQIESPAELRAWLEANYTQADGVWAVTFKKHAGEKYVSYDQVVDEIICFGWIDSLPRKLDDDRTMLWIAPRKGKGSNWSRVNKERVERMIAAGKMHPAGQVIIDQAKADGSWTALDAIENLEIPDDLAAEFDQYDDAAANFNAFPRSAKRGILEWIFNAKRPATRAKRIAETARLAQDNIRANQWRGR
ncbi:MAG: YdeI/OmpD-associated family protein [Chloroflexota bacterium]